MSGSPARPAAIGVAAAFVGIPLAAYGGQVYPEMPAALAVITAVALLTRPRRTWRHEVGVLAAVVALPWLAVKYVAGRRRARHRPADRRTGHDRRRVVVLAARCVVAAAVYLVAHQRWYGGWTVYATGDHFAETGELAVVGTQVNLLGRARRLAGLLVDRDFGIAAWSPVWLLAPFGLGLLVRARLARAVDRRRRARRRLAQRHLRRPDDARLLGARAPDRRRAPARRARRWPPSPPGPGALADRRRRRSAPSVSSTGAGWRSSRRPAGAR